MCVLKCKNDGIIIIYIHIATKLYDLYCAACSVWSGLKACDGDWAGGGVSSSARPHQTQTHPSRVGSTTQVLNYSISVTWLQYLQESSKSAVLYIRTCEKLVNCSQQKAHDGTHHSTENEVNMRVFVWGRLLLQLSQNSFSMVLLDKQGVDKQRYTFPITAAEIFTTIDTFPLRTEEAILQKEAGQSC